MACEVDVAVQGRGCHKLIQLSRLLYAEMQPIHQSNISGDHIGHHNLLNIPFHNLKPCATCSTPLVVREREKE